MILGGISNILIKPVNNLTSALRRPYISLAVIFALSTVGLGFAASPEGPTGNAVHLQRISEAPEGGNRQFLCQNDINLHPDEAYLLTFWAKSPQSVSMRVSMKVSQPPWGSVGTPQQVELTPEWQKYEVSIEGTGAVPEHTRLSFNFGDAQAADIWLADFRLRGVGSDESSTDNLMSNARFENGLEKWYSEGQRAGVFQVNVQSLTEAATP